MSDLLSFGSNNVTQILYSRDDDLCPNGAAYWLFVAGICLIVSNGQFEKITLNIVFILHSNYKITSSQPSTPGLRFTRSGLGETGRSRAKRGLLGSLTRRPLWSWWSSTFPCKSGAQGRSLLPGEAGPTTLKNIRKTWMNSTTASLRQWYLPFQSSSLNG